MPRSHLHHLLCVAALTCAACGSSDDVTGSSTMPEDFGRAQTAVLSCPDLDGVFALPAAQGHPFGYERTTGLYRAARYSDFFGLPLQDAEQLWVSGPRLGEAQPLTLRTRASSRNPPVSDNSVREWPRAELSAGEYDCQEGWLNVMERDWDKAGAAGWFGGGGVRITARITRLLDGSLVVGQAIRVWGRGSSWVVAGHTLFTSHEPDRVIWYWSRFAPILSGGVEAPRDSVPRAIPATAVTAQSAPVAMAAAEPVR